MKYNDIIEVQVSTDASTEPVTIDEVKRHLNLQFDTSGSYDFDDDDTYLTSLISIARETIEQYTGLSLAPKTLVAILRNECGDIEIPKGPVSTITTIKDSDGNTLTEGTDLTTRGNQFKWIESPCSCYLEVTYTAGYADDEVPKALKRAILEEITFRYNMRGDQTNQYSDQKIGICQGAMELASPFKRMSWVA